MADRELILPVVLLMLLLIALVVSFVGCVVIGVLDAWRGRR